MEKHAPSFRVQIFLVTAKGYVFLKPMPKPLQGDGFGNILVSKDYWLVFQPIVWVRTGRVHHYEALLRRNFHTGKFIPVD